MSTPAPTPKPLEALIAKCPGCGTRPCKCAELRKAKLARQQQEQASALVASVADAVTADRLKKAQDAAKRRAIEEGRLTDMLLQVLGVDYTWEFEGDPVPIANVGRFRFSLDGDYQQFLSVLKRCPDCQKEVPCIITSLLTLDDSVELGWPHKNGECVKQHTETAEQRFLKAVREFIAENSYQGG